MAPSKDEKNQAKSSGHKSEDLEGKDNEWKFRIPYKVHEKAGEGKGEGGGAFKAVYEGGCHCGRVKYQLSREKPLKAKYCHCGTCQVLHGELMSWEEDVKIMVMVVGMEGEGVC